MRINKTPKSSREYKADPSSCWSFQVISKRQVIASYNTRAEAQQYINKEDNKQ